MKTLIVTFHMFCWILVVSTAEQSSSDELNDFQLSNTYDKWSNTPANCHIARLKHFHPKLLSWLQDRLPEEESIWIGARAKPTKYFQLYGCAKHNKPLEMDKIKHFKANSAAKCMTHCGEKEFALFGLMGDICVCMTSGALVTYDASSCTTSCTGNINDWCGYNETTMTLYEKHNELDPNTELDRRCVVIGNTSSHLPKRCSDSYGFKCANTGVNKTPVTWSQAVESCRTDNTKRLEAPNKYLGREVWTPLLRSSHISWDTVTNISEFPWCISIRKTKDKVLSLHEEGCAERFKHLLSCDPVDDEFPVTTVALIVSCLFAACLLCVIAFFFYRKRQSRKKPRTKSFSNDIYDNEIPSRTVMSRPRNTNHVQTSPEYDGVSSAYTTINAVDGYSEATDINSQINMHKKQQGAGTNNQSSNDNAACNGKTTDEGTHDFENDHVYDHTNTNTVVNKQSENVYSHTCTAIKEGPRGEDVYDRTNTTINRHDANVYDHTSKITKGNRNNENVYDHSGTPDKQLEGNHELNMYDRSTPPGKEEDCHDENVYDQTK